MFTHASVAAPAERPDDGFALRRADDVVLPGGARVATFLAGRTDADAPTLVFVHGLGHWAFAAWEPLARAYAGTHRVAAFDLPGFGNSDKPDAPYTLSYFTDVLERVVDALAIATFGLVGHSFGGLIAANYAARNPTRVRALALVDPAGFLRTPKIVLRVAGSRPVGWLFRNLKPSRGFVNSSLDASVFDPRSIAASERARAFALSRDPALTRAFARVYGNAMQEMLHLRSLHRSFARYGGTALLVWGKDDRYVPFAGLAQARAVYPQAAVLAIDRCGHCPQIEYPELVERALRALEF